MPASPSPARRMRVPSSTPCGILTDKVRSRVTRPEPAQEGQASSIIWPRAWQPGQVPLGGKNPVALPSPPSPAAGRAGLRLGAGLGAGTRTGFAGDGDRNLDLRGLALEGFFQRDFHVVAQVGAALASAAPALAGHAEQIFENVGERRSKARTKARTAAHAALLEGRMAEPVIGGALVAVSQDLVGFVDFLEADFAGGITGILVRVPLHRKLAESRLQLGLIRGAVDLKGFVIAALGGHPSHPAEVRFHPKAMREKCILRLNEK